MKRLLFISTGYFSTLSFAVLLNSTHKKSFKNCKIYLLIILFKEDSSSKDAIIHAKKQVEFAKNCYKNWFAIDVILEENFPLSVYDTADCSRIVLDNLFGDLGVTQLKFHSLFVTSCNLIGKINQHMAFKKFYLVDEGIGTYFQVINNYTQHKIDGFFAFFSQNLLATSLNNVHYKLSIKALRSILYKLNKIYKTPSVEEKTFIIAISSFYFIKQEKPLLLQEYFTCIQNLKEEYNCLIACHPRNDIKEIRTKAGELFDNLAMIPQHVPILDMFIFKNKRNILGIASMNSSVLFTAKFIYNINTYYIKSEIEDAYTSSISKLYKDHIKLLSDIK